MWVGFGFTSDFLRVKTGSPTAAIFLLIMGFLQNWHAMIYFKKIRKNEDCYSLLNP